MSLITNKEMRANRGVSPIPAGRFNQMRKHAKAGEHIVMNQRHQEQPDEFYGQPIGPELPRMRPPPPQPNHPILRHLGLIGLGGGLGAGIYHFRKPLMKLGQKAINYATDKFHHLMTPTNETIESLQNNNREAF